MKTSFKFLLLLISLASCQQEQIITPSKSFRCAPLDVQECTFTLINGDDTMVSTGIGCRTINAPLQGGVEMWCKDSTGWQRARFCIVVNGELVLSVCTNGATFWEL